MGACDQIPKAPASKSAEAIDPLAGDLDRMEAGIRIAAANKRIDELDRKVGALEATPEKVDLELLTQRVTALEVKSAGDGAPTSQAAPAAEAAQPTRSTPRTGSKAARSPVVNSRLTLPELENRPRLATPAETKSFSPVK
jgi:hypothetical protein